MLLFSCCVDKKVNVFDSIDHLQNSFVIVKTVFFIVPKIQIKNFASHLYNKKIQNTGNNVCTILDYKTFG
jgi:hypothetical protein